MKRYSIALALVVILMVTASFSAGYGIAIRSYSEAAQAGPNAAAAGTPAELEKQFAVFWEAWNIVNKDFYDRKALDSQKQTYGAISGMIEALGDPHSGFSTPEQSIMNNQDLRGAFGGIGATLEAMDRFVVVVAPIPDTPAEKIGIRAGDVIIEVNGEKIEGLTVNEVVSRIRGPVGTEVTLQVVRQGERQPLVFTIVRAEIKVASVKAEIKSGDVAYIRLTSFTETTSKNLMDELKKVLEAKPKSIVLDMRNNPGGLLHVSVEVASIFQTDGPILFEEDKDGKRITFNAQKMAVTTKLPMVVMINKGSASASEIVAGALKDTGRAKLVGQQSFGKGSVQTMRQLSDGSSVRITIANFFSPNNGRINKVGIEPDVTVDFTEEDRRAGKDPQLDKAIEIAKEAAR